MEELKDFIARHRKNPEKSQKLSEYLYSLINARGIKKDSYVYTKANITKQAWSAIVSDKVNPSINTCIKIGLALELDNHECKYLLKKAGYTLASSSVYALIIRYCFENKLYDLCTLNDYLEEYGYPVIA